MYSKIELQNKIETLENELKEYKKFLNQIKPESIQEAKVGEVMKDGSIVVYKENGVVLLLAPVFTEVYVEWSKDFSEVFGSLSNYGLNASQWFIPSKKQLMLASKQCPDTLYWTSDEVDGTFAWYVGGIARCGTQDKTKFAYVRAMKCVNY